MRADCPQNTKAILQSAHLALCCRSFMKMDWCSASVARLQCEKQYGEMAKALNATGRQIALYLLPSTLLLSTDQQRETERDTETHTEIEYCSPVLF